MNRDHVSSSRPASSDLPHRPDRSGPRELDRERALELLGRAAVGRVVYTVDALPAVLPVTFRLVPGGVLVSAPADSELARAVDGALIAFEADEVDGRDGSGWFVTVLDRGPGSVAPGCAGVSSGRVVVDTVDSCGSVVSSSTSLCGGTRRTRAERSQHRQPTGRSPAGC